MFILWKAFIIMIVHVVVTPVKELKIFKIFLPENKHDKKELSFKKTFTTNVKIHTHV